MTQRIFDVENEKDMADLWDIVPENIVKIRKAYKSKEGHFINFYDTNYIEGFYATAFLIIDWHDKTEITRPVQEASEADIGKICYFWAGKDSAVGILKEIDNNNSTLDNYCMEDGKSGIWFIHCRRLTKQEIEELC